jgi:hypothetical protein
LPDFTLGMRRSASRDFHVKRGGGGGPGLSSRKLRAPFDPLSPSKTDAWVHVHGTTPCQCQPRFPMERPEERKQRRPPARAVSVPPRLRPGRGGGGGGGGAPLPPSLLRSTLHRHQPHQRVFSAVVSYSRPGSAGPSKQTHKARRPAKSIGQHNTTRNATQTQQPNTTPPTIT